MPRYLRALLTVLVVSLIGPSAAAAATSVTIVADGDPRVNVSTAVFADGEFSAAEPPSGAAFVEAGSISGFAGDLTIEASSTITVDAAVSKPTGDLELAAGDIRFPGSDGSVTLGDGSMRFAGEVRGPGDVRAGVPQDQSITFTDTIGNVRFAALDLEGGTVELPDLVYGTGNIDIDATVTGDQVYLDTSGSITTGDIVASGRVGLFSYQGSASTGLITGGDADVYCSGDATLEGARVTNPSRNFYVLSGGAVRIGSPALTAKNVLDLPAGAGAQIASGGALSVDVSGDVRFRNVNATGRADLNVTGALTVDQVRSDTAVSLKAPDGVVQAAGSVTGVAAPQLDAYSVNGDIDLSGDNDVPKVGQLYGKTVALSSYRDLQTTAPVTSLDGPVTLSAPSLTVRDGVFANRAGAQRADVLLRATDTDATFDQIAYVYGDEVVVDAARNLVNRVGAGLMNAGDRWLVYADNPQDSTFGGLDSGSAPRWNATASTVPPAQIPGTRYAFAQQPTVTLTAPTLDKPFGQDATATLAATAPSVAGVVPAEPGVYTAGTPFDGPTPSTSPGTAARATPGTYPTTVDLSGATARDGYRLQTAQGQLRVGEAPAAPPTPSPAPPATTPPTAEKPTPQPRVCRSARDVRFTIRLPRRATRLRATVNGKTVPASGVRARLSRTGRSASVRVDLRGQPRTVFNVRVTVRVGKRTVLVKKKTLRTCSPRR